MQPSERAPHASLVRLIGPVYLPMGCLSFSWSGMIPAFPAYLAGLGAGVAAVGLALSMRGIGQLASDLPGGVIMARFGLRRVMIVSYVVVVLAGVAFLFAASVVTITLLLLVSGLFASVLITGMMTLIRTTIDADLRGRASALAGGALRVGMLLGPPLGGLIADGLGMTSVFALRCAALSVGLFSFARTVPAHERFSAQHRPLLASLQALRRGLRDRVGAIVTIGFAILVLSLLRTAREIVLPLWGARIGLGATEIGLAIGVGAAFDLAAFVPAGMIADRFGRKVSSSVCIGLFSLGLLLLVPARAIWGFVVAGAVVGLGNGFGAGINMTTGTDLAPNGAVAEFIGLWRLYGDLGAALGPVVVSALAAALSLPPAVLTIAAIGWSGFAVMALWAPESRDIARSDRHG